MDSGIFKHRGILYFAIVLIFFLGAYFVYCSQAAQTFEQAKQAYQAQDWSLAKNNLRKMQTTYQLSLPNHQQEVRNYLYLSTQMDTLEKAKLTGDFELVYEAYDDIRIQSPDTFTSMGYDKEQITYFSNLLSKSYEEKKYSDAIAIFDYIQSQKSLQEDISSDTQLLVNVYSDWAVDLKKNEKYSESIDILKLLLKEYPQYIDNDAIAVEINDLHSLNITDLIEKSKYDEAEAELSHILNQTPDPDMDENGRKLFTETIVSYAASFHTKHEYQKEIELLETTQEKFAEVIDTELVSNQLAAAHAAYADQLMNNGEFYDAMINFQLAKNSTTDMELLAGIDEKISQNNLLLLADSGDEGQKILDQIQNEVCLGTFEFPEIIEDIPSSANKALICGNTDYMFSAAQLAQNLSELKYIIQLEKDVNIVQTCRYIANYSMVRRQNKLIISLYDIDKNRITYTTTLLGSLPDACPGVHYFKSKEETIYGSEVSTDEVDKWLNSLVK
jgi:tetratricopeptide (TPR) repeat protein